MENLQLSENKELQHLLSIKGLDKKLIEKIFNDSEKFLGKKDEELNKYTSLNGKTVSTSVISQESCWNKPLVINEEKKGTVKPEVTVYYNNDTIDVDDDFREFDDDY